MRTGRWQPHPALRWNGGRENKARGCICNEAEFGRICYHNDKLVLMFSRMPTCPVHGVATGSKHG
jgi:hypothetical protein